MIKLIASDVDGTLVKDSSPEIDPEYIPLLREVADQGIYFAVASGRQYGSIRKMFEEVERNLIYIAENGAHIVMGGKTISMVEMNRSYVEEIIFDLREFYNQDCHIVASTTDGCLLESKDERFIDLMREGYRNDVRFTSDILKEKEPIIKVSLYRNKDIRSIGENVLIPKWKNRVKSCMAGEEWVDFMDFSVDKGKALRYVQNKLGISYAETMVFGDNDNDKGLIQAAKYSYAVETAVDTIKDAARYVCPSYEEKGVYQTIKRVVLE